MTPNIMNKTQRLRVAHKVIIHAIWRQLSTLATGMKKLCTLATGILNINYQVMCILVVVLTINPSIYMRNASVLVAPQRLLTPAMKEFVADAVLGGAWVNSTPQNDNRTGINGSTPDNMGNIVSVEHALSPVMIGVIGKSPSCGLNESLKVSKINANHFPRCGW